MRRPEASEYKPYFKSYIDLVQSNEPTREMLQSMHFLHAMLTRATEQQGNYRYEEGKWTVKEMLMHIIDVERIMAYRGLAVSRKEEANLLPFDDQLYVTNSGANQRTLECLLLEHQAVRMASIRMFDGFTDEMLSRKGLSGGGPITAGAIAFIIPGHEIHHANVLKERYLGKTLNV